MPEQQLVPPIDTINVTRVVTTAEALANATVPADAIVLTTAPDEALVVGATEGTPPPVEVDDPHAIIVEDAGWCGAWIPAIGADAFLDRECSWTRPTERPAFAQGMVAHLPVKLWFEADRTLFVVPHVSANELTLRMREAGIA